MGSAEVPVERVDDESLDGLDRQEDIARFPYVEFTGRDSITCPTCQGSGRIPSDQVNELVALIPYSDQRLQPQRTKQYVGLSVIVCLFVCSLVTFFMFPRPVLVEDGGIRSVIIHFDHDTSRVLINMTMNFTVNVEISGSLSYVYAFCTMASIKVHNIVVFTQTSVKTSCMVRSAQNTLEAYRYIDCGANSTLHHPPDLHGSVLPHSSYTY
ncbi:transmembrane protein 106C-like isoform X2 [Tachysurus fulvidraco]|uniref:transmembrane protein 106C-like isoform X2 n=1 Tax=Tachysurus fulvidraco TaxID=1234273 RepID=UPI001FEE3F5A|nr:transmembrane protein 106C-like isoform X2 [Tachysurus fulvidraco]XP_047665813.1 transmembrane protein 106C-like isoform X2 [Tachysurus fulvidraco]XP_047676966.1 transmembrane protein 106C-like isoform X2 [Tachysurus fulvidraco]